MSGANRVGAALKRKLGPLPVWAWAIIAGGVLYWYRNRGGSASSSGTGADLQPLAGGPGDNSGAGGGTGGGTGGGDGDGTGGGRKHKKRQKHPKRRRRHHKPPPHHGRGHPPHRPEPKPKRRVKGRKHPHRDRRHIHHRVHLRGRHRGGAGNPDAGIPAALRAGQTRHRGARTNTGADFRAATVERPSSPPAEAPARRSRAMSGPGQPIRSRAYQAPTAGAPAPRQKVRPAQGTKTATTAQAAGAGKPRGTRHSARIHHRRRRS